VGVTVSAAYDTPGHGVPVAGKPVAALGKLSPPGR